MELTSRDVGCANNENIISDGLRNNITSSLINSNLNGGIAKIVGSNKQHYDLKIHKYINVLTHQQINNHTLKC